MKLNSLTIAILLASATTLISCGDDEKKPEGKKEAPVSAVAEQQKSVEKIDLAEVAEARYRNLATITNQTVAAINQSGRSPWKDMKVVIEDYQRGENQATAKETATLTPNANFGFVNNPVIITSKSTIAYSPELLKEGLVAQVNYHDLDMSSLSDNLNISPEFKDIIDTISSHLDIQADLLTDNNVKTVIKVNPFTKDFGTEKGEGITLDIQGADATFTYNEKEVVEHLGVGKWVAHVQPVEIKPKEEEGLFSFKGFDLEQTLTPDGNFTLTVSPLQLTFFDGDEGGTLDIAGITEKGTGVVFDPNLSGFLGEVSGEVGDVSFTAKKDEQKVSFGNTQFASQTLKNEQGNYDLSGNTNFNFNGEALQKYFELPFLLKNLVISGELKNLSPETLELLTKFAQLEQMEKVEETQEKELTDSLNALLNNLNLNKTHLDGSVTLTTEKGDASIDFSLALNGAEDSLNLIKAIEDSGENLDILFSLLQENIDFKAEIKINREILAAFGMAELVEMQAGDMITNNNGILTVTVENHGDGLKINGKPMF